MDLETFWESVRPDASCVFSYFKAPRIITAAVYKHLGETMEFLWDKELKMHTVHVEDVCAALWHLTSNGENGEIFNLADTGDTGNLFHSIYNRSFRSRIY